MIRLSIDMKRELHRKIKLQATEDEQSMRRFVIDSIEFYLRHIEGQSDMLDVFHRSIEADMLYNI